LAHRGLIAPRSIKRVWMLTFELAPIVKLGGLGEAVYLYAKSLSQEGIEVTVLMPSHGRHLDLGARARYGLKPLDFAACGSRRGVDGNKYDYCLGAEEAFIDNFRVVLFKGLDYSTGVVFDSWSPYSYVEEKAALLARAVRAFSWTEVQPDIIHMNDWHTVLAGVALRDEFEKRGYAIPLLYTIHLSGSPSFPWHYASSDWAGLDDSPHLVWKVYRHEPVSNRNAWDSVGGNVEAFGVIEADTLQTVSYSYLNEELKRKYGDWIGSKSCVVYNATDWSLEEVERWIKSSYGTIDHQVLFEIIDKYIRPGSWTDDIDKRLAPFLIAGRLTSQKGIDLAIRALDYAPSASLVVLGIPVGDYGYEQYVRRLAEERRGRVIISTNRLPNEVYRALVRLSTSMLAPSRWEPFGLVAAESLSLGTPVIATAVGGLKEIVVDIRSGKGDGLLVRPEDPHELGLAMESMTHIMWDHDVERIPIERLRSMAQSEPTLDSYIREFAINDVNNRFRPKSAAAQLLSCYDKARQMAYYKAITT